PPKPTRPITHQPPLPAALPSSEASPMNRSSLAFSLACFAVFASGAHARADTQSKNDETQLQASDFAYGMQLEPTPGQALQTFVLPHEVLEHLSVQRAELVVTNRIGERVPHAVRQLRASDQER